MDAAEMRAGLRRLAKAVVIVTTRDVERRYAMAATAVSEVSMDPPSVLVCVNRGAAINAPLAAGADFCLNILHSSHEAISADCGGRERGEERFNNGAWAGSDSGAPYLEDAQARFMCRNDRAIDYGTHTIYIGVVQEAVTAGPVDPLIYVDGRYTVVRPAAEQDSARQLEALMWAHPSAFGLEL